MEDGQLGSFRFLARWLACNANATEKLGQVSNLLYFELSNDITIVTDTLQA